MKQYHSIIYMKTRRVYKGRKTSRNTKRQSRHTKRQSRNTKRQSRNTKRQSRHTKRHTRKIGGTNDTEYLNALKNAKQEYKMAKINEIIAKTKLRKEIKLAQVCSKINVNDYTLDEKTLMKKYNLNKKNLEKCITRNIVNQKQYMEDNEGNDFSVERSNGSYGFGNDIPADSFTRYGQEAPADLNIFNNSLPRNDMVFNYSDGSPL